MTKQKPKKQHKLGVRPETWRKFNLIAKITRRSVAETADILADEFLKNPASSTTGASRTSSEPDTDGKTNRLTSV